MVHRELLAQPRRDGRPPVNLVVRRVLTGYRQLVDERTAQDVVAHRRAVRRVRRVSHDGDATGWKT